MMLEATLTTVFQPGTNLKGGSAGGNWSYALPTLEREQVVTLGIPSAATMVTLARSAQRVLVICATNRQFRTAEKLVEGMALGEIVFPRRSPGIAAGSTDLLVLCSRTARIQFVFLRKYNAQWVNWLKPDGTLYFEAAGLEFGLLSLSRIGSGAWTQRAAQQLWITPHFGESQTFVPQHDRQTIQFFRDRGLVAASLRPTHWKGQLALTAAARKSPDDGEGRPTRNATPKRANDEGGFLRRLQRSARPAARLVRSLVDRCERALSRPGGPGKLLARRGVVCSSHTPNGSQGPPQYLRSIAQQSGISLDGYRWGLSATGDYDSRKLVFFLFESGRQLPHFAVKMTRSKKYNRRLEQERRALELLEDFGIGDTDTLPRIAFAGTHGELAIVGETAIHGVPFDQRTTATGSCPYARSAIEWLTELGSTTAAPFAAEPGEVAAGLQQLLKRFAELYSITPDEYSFLAAQIAVLEFHRIPLVFQHGDPGRWNVLVTPHGRISFLDWEAAERHGLPLWDLLYFLRSFAMCAAEAAGCKDRLGGLNQVLLHDSPVAELAIESVRNYCVDTGLSSQLVEPLYHTCWMHRALKEATRLPSGKLRDGHYFNFLRMCKENREAPTLQRMFALN